MQYEVGKTILIKSGDTTVEAVVTAIHKSAVSGDTVKLTKLAEPVTTSKTIGFNFLDFVSSHSRNK